MIDKGLCAFVWKLKLACFLLFNKGLVHAAIVKESVCDMFFGVLDNAKEYVDDVGVKSVGVKELDGSYNWGECC